MTSKDKELEFSDNRNLRQARITTKTAQEMLGLLKEHPFELVGRGPHEMEDGSYVAEVIGVKEELEKIKELKYDIKIKYIQRIEMSDKEISTTNRYAKKDVIPRGVGIKK